MWILNFRNPYLNILRFPELKPYLELNCNEKVPKCGQL